MSSSLLTNTSAMTALLALNQTQDTLSKYENQVSTGLSISSASDNAAYWSIASKMSSNVGALGAVSNALSESSSLVSTMSTALTQTISVLDSIKNDLITAQEPGASLSSIQTDIAAQQQLLMSIGESANFNGQNWLDTTGGTVNLVSSYDSTNGISTIAVDTTATQLFETASASATEGILGQAGTNYTSASILSLSVTSATTGDITNMLKDVEAAIGNLTTAASTLGATSTNVTDQQTYISNLTDSLTAGVGSLVDADMNMASTKISALQVQQQLGIQALSIANSNTQMILKLFGQ